MKHPLNFDWGFYPDFDERYLSQSIKPKEIVDLPHAPVLLPLNYFSEKEYQGKFTYIKEFDFDDFENKRVFLRFDGVMLKVHCYLNGTDLGEKLSGWLPVEYEITDTLNDKHNRLIVVVDSNEDPLVPPFGKVVDYLTFAGIYRPVSIISRPKTYISSLYVRGDKLGNIHCEIETVGDDIPNIHYELLKDGKVIKTSENKDFSIENPDIWDIDAPNLYTLKAVINCKGIIDEKEVSFGFRDAIFKEDGFYLNGKILNLFGLNRHQNYPYVGPCMPEAAQREDANILKYRLGCNVVRTSHYPQSEFFLDECDRIGLLVIDEIPGWQFISEVEEWRNNYYYFLEGMIKKERNHPSLIAYGTRIDESWDDDALYGKAYKLAKELDPIRQTIGVRNYKDSHCIEDIYGYNDFSCGDLSHGADQGKKTKGAKGHPILISEHNGHMFPTKQFDFFARRTEHALRHLKVANDAFGDNRISGAIGWCTFDYNTHCDFGAGDHICYHGVMDIFRNPKTAGYAYLSQNSKTPMMWVSNPLSGGENDEARLVPLVVFTNCDYVEFYRGDKFIERFYPDKKRYPNLKHPPIFIDDFIGESFKQEGFPKKAGNKVKRFLNMVAAEGYAHLSAKKAMPYLFSILRCGLNLDKLTKLYYKYLSGWGEEAASYSVIGYKDGNKVVEKKAGPTTETNYRFERSKDELLNRDTYDVSRLSIKAVDEWGSQLHYDFSIVSFETMGPIEVIGPKQVTLQGGDISTYIRSKKVKEPSVARLIVHTPKGDFSFDYKVS